MGIIKKELQIKENFIQKYKRAHAWRLSFSTSAFNCKIHSKNWFISRCILYLKNIQFMIIKENLYELNPSSDYIHVWFFSRSRTNSCQIHGCACVYRDSKKTLQVEFQARFLRKSSCERAACRFQYRHPRL